MAITVQGLAFFLLLAAGIVVALGGTIVAMGGTAPTREGQVKGGIIFGVGAAMAALGWWGLF